MSDLDNSTVVTSLVAYIALFAMFVYALLPMVAPLFRIALFVLVWAAAFRLADSRTPFEHFLMLLFMLDSCALVCSVAGGTADGFGAGAGALRVVLSISFLALYALTRLP